MTTSGRAVRVAIVDDQALMRSGLRLIMDAEDDLTVVGEAGDGREAIDLVGRAAPDVVLLDIRMPVLDGLAATRGVLARPGAPAIIVLTTFDRDEYVFEALRAGASGFLLKNAPPEELLDSPSHGRPGSPVGRGNDRQVDDHLIGVARKVKTDEGAALLQHAALPTALDSNRLQLLVRGGASQPASPRAAQPHSNGRVGADRSVGTSRLGATGSTQVATRRPRTLPDRQTPQSIGNDRRPAPT